MENIETLTQLLRNSECEYQIYDLGRRILPIEDKLFSSIEQGQQPYPYPLQRQAHLAVAYWNERKEPWIWFLKFPLDERGLLRSSDIGNFIRFVVEAMGSRLTGHMDEKQEQKLANNPYTFKPADDKMAMFHSLIRARLNMPTSQYYEHAQHYFGGGLGWDKWQTIGLQGITDICARISQEQNGVMLRKSLRHLPTEPRYALLGALEHITLPEKLAETILELALEECRREEPDLFLISAYARAMAGAGPEQLSQLVNEILASVRLSHQEVLVGIAGRSWQALQNTSSAEQFLLRLAQTNNQALFNQLFADLVMLPALRMVLLPLLHGNPSPELAQALVKLQTATKSKAKG